MSDHEPKPNPADLLHCAEAGDAIVTLEGYGSLIARFEEYEANLTAQHDDEVRTVAEAHSQLIEATKKYDDALNQHRGTEAELVRIPRWRANAVNAAKSDLAASSSKPEDTFIAQTALEGRDYVAASQLPDTLADFFLGEFTSPTERARFIVLGSFPVSNMVKIPEDLEVSRRESSITFLDVDPTDIDRSGMTIQRIHGKHVIEVATDSARTIYLSEQASLVNSSIDHEPAKHVINADPLEIKLVKTEKDFSELIKGAEVGIHTLMGRNGSISFGPGEENALNAAIITGPAAILFTEWLSRTEWLRTSVLLATIDPKEGVVSPAYNLHTLVHAETARRNAVREFEGMIDNFVGAFAANPALEIVQSDLAEQAKSKLIFSKEAQEYLGITDKMLADRIIQTLASKTYGIYGNLEPISPVNTGFQNINWRPKSTIELAEHVTRQMHRLGGFFDEDHRDFTKYISLKIDLYAVNAIISANQNEKQDKEQKYKMQKILAQQASIIGEISNIQFEN